MAQKIDIKSLYSCRRSKNWMTFFAVFMFILMILMELYLIIVVPVELKKRSVLNKQTAKLELVRQMDNLRPSVRNTRVKDDVQAGEKELVKNMLDFYADFLRDNRDSLTMLQLVQMKMILNEYMSVWGRWISKPPRFYMVRESLNTQPIIASIGKMTEEE